MNQDFVTWALDPKRSDEEAFFAELVTENGYDAWCRKNIKGYYGRNWQEKMERHRVRRLNPAHRTQLEPQDVERAAEMLAGPTRLWLGDNQDRPIRDLTGLRFFPQLRELRLGHAELTDLSLLTSLPELEEFDLWDTVIEDLRPVTTLKKLRQLTLSIKEPWPLVDGLSRLTELERFTWFGNLLAVEGVGAFPKMKYAVLGHGVSELPVRDLTRLPAMPLVEQLTLACVRRLEGVEQWPRLVELKVTGTFRDLEPLTHLPAVTHLRLWCDERLDLSVLCRMPALRMLELTTMQPQEWFVLTDAPHLHEVKTSRCEANEREVASLQEVLRGWEPDFLLPAPRPLPALEFIALEQEQWQQRRGPPEPGPWAGNYEMEKVEGEWFLRRLQRELDKRLGPGWGHARYGITVEKLEAAERLPEIIAVVREMLAWRCRRRSISLQICLRAPDLPKKKRPPESEEKRLKREFAEHVEWERRWKEEAELREREHKLRQLQQEGVKIDPEEFEPEPEPLVVEELEADNEVYEDEDQYEPHLLADDYDLYADVSEAELLVHATCVEAAERLIGRTAKRRE